MSEQDRYQVRFDWGVPGAAAIGGDIVVWVDALGEEPVPLAALAARDVVRADLRTAVTAARWLLERQRALGARQQIAVVAAGAARGDGWRTAVEDELAAGAVIAALGELGIDATSPEAAAAEAAYRGLGRALGPLFAASVSGRADPPAPGAGRADPGASLVVLRAPQPAAGATSSAR
ncbi:MAG: hypothetical protein QM635_06745 [Microbacteriaceae bacterium]